MDKFDLTLDVPKIKVTARSEENEIYAKQLENILNFKYKEVLEEVVKRIKQEAKYI